MKIDLCTIKFVVKHAHVREKEIEQKSLKEKLMKEKRKLNKKQYERRLKEEELRIKQQQKELQKLEKTELKLIKRLKSTQLAQQKALDGLEQTINCNRPNSSAINGDIDLKSDNDEDDRLLTGSSRDLKKMDTILEASFDTTK